MKKLDPKMILADMRRLFDEVGQRNFCVVLYNNLGRYSLASVVNHFGSWNHAMYRAGLPMKSQGRPSLEAERVVAGPVAEVPPAPDRRALDKQTDAGRSSTAAIEARPALAFVIKNEAGGGGQAQGRSAVRVQTSPRGCNGETRTSTVRPAADRPSPAHLRQNIGLAGSTKEHKTWKKESLEIRPQPGRRRCLKCDNVFNSWDVKKNRICETCNHSNEGILDLQCAL